MKDAHQGKAGAQGSMGALEGVATNYSLMILSQRVREVALSADIKHREEVDGEGRGAGGGAEGGAGGGAGDGAEGGASGAAADGEGGGDVKAPVAAKRKAPARRTLAYKSQNEPDLLPLLVSEQVFASKPLES